MVFYWIGNRVRVKVKYLDKELTVMGVSEPPLEQRQEQFGTLEERPLEGFQVADGLRDDGNRRLW